MTKHDSFAKLGCQVRNFAAAKIARISSKASTGEAAHRTISRSLITRRRGIHQ